ncbi:uncharacterized protein LOC132200592 [Neocloeon triangulifer]|uniref:uncharacterized protein LOC132200592 n=1 Tax=Neocloeon triangulifer TaxID=2078957 RepID=UPI00286F86AA|nr:uncharacterized protein LOC132200592 [Neocloeon triangulifer]
MLSQQLSTDRPGVASPVWTEKAKRRQQSCDYQDDTETTPLNVEDEEGSTPLNRRKEEAKVLRILRRRLALVAEERQVPSEIPPICDMNQPTNVLAKLLRKKQPLAPSPLWAQLDTDWGDSEFISDCIRWHNIFRQKHSAEPLTMSSQLCAYAQAWANHLAHTNTFYYRNDRQIGQNLFCRPTGPQAHVEISGRDVALHWYGAMRQYDFFKGADRLHANVNAGHFTQLVWGSSKQLGLGKAQSRNGRVVVVANYYPPGNVNGLYQKNVRPPLPGSDLRFDMSMVHEGTESASGYSLSSSSSSVDSEESSVMGTHTLLPHHRMHRHLSNAK